MLSVLVIRKSAIIRLKTIVLNGRIDLGCFEKLGKCEPGANPTPSPTNSDGRIDGKTAKSQQYGPIFTLYARNRSDVSIV